jgi:hypothetical protein
MNRKALILAILSLSFFDVQSQNVEDIVWHGGVSLGLASGDIGGRGSFFSPPVVIQGTLSKIISRNAEVGGSGGVTLNSMSRGTEIDAKNFSLFFRSFRYDKFGSLAPIGRFWGLELEYNDWVYNGRVSESGGGSRENTGLEQDFVMPYLLLGYQGLLFKKITFTSTFKLGTFPLRIDEASTSLTSTDILLSKLVTLEYALGYAF